MALKGAYPLRKAKYQKGEIVLYRRPSLGPGEIEEGRIRRRVMAANGHWFYCVRGSAGEDKWTPEREIVVVLSEGIDAED